jgi:alkylation response protein AidB-like acyl-CoA dehydrogenase
MSFDREELEQLQQACRAFFARHASEERLRRHLEDSPSFDDELWERVAEQGWALLPFPEEQGGAGGGVADLAVIAEESGRCLQAPALTTTLTASWVLARHGVPGENEALAEELLEGAGITFSGESVDRAGNGQKTALVAEAEHAQYLLAPRADGGLDLVARAGFKSVEQRETMDLVRRYSDVVLGHAKPAQTIDDDTAAADLFQTAVVLQCAESVGVASALLDMTVSYAKQRQQFGRPIGGFQAIKHRLADMYIQLESAKVATSAAADAIDGDHDRAASVHTAKSVTGRAVSWIASQALQIHGGIGFTWEHVLHLYLRRAKVNELLLGTPAWHERALVDLLAEEQTAA